MSNRTFTIGRAKEDEATFVEVLGLCAKQARQGAFAPLNTDKVSMHAYRMMADGLMILARNAAGKAIAMLPLSEEMLAYADQTYLQNLGLWIEPEWRTTGVLRALLAEARRETEKRETFCLITITDPDRRKKGGRAIQESEMIGFVSVGYTLKLESKRHGR